MVYTILVGRNDNGDVQVYCNCGWESETYSELTSVAVFFDLVKNHIHKRENRWGFLRNISDHDME